ncbi:MAG: CinA family protein [Betaproteobacteria bacterium]|nr:CinA family protein [Betaproteobacteria bacterium]
MSHPAQAELEALAIRVGAALLARGERTATAESCTGGWISQCLTAIPGSSDWFDRGFVTYSNEAKEEMLGVPRELLQSQGAVSEATAAAMAQGALARSRAQWALAVSGIAGPAGGSPAKPVGTVCFAWAGPDGLLEVSTSHFPGDREGVRAHTVQEALAGLLDLLNRLQQTPVLA